MYVISVKLDKKKISAILSALCLVLAVSFAFMPKTSSDVLGSKVNTSAKSNSDHVLFLKQYGYEVSEKPIQVEEIFIPSDFSEEYIKYNEYQKISGFDLSKYKNYRVKKFTYKINNYENTDQEVIANVIVYDNKIIGGDICSTSLGGFVHGFIKE